MKQLIMALATTVLAVNGAFAQGLSAPRGSLRQLTGPSVMKKDLRQRRRLLTAAGGFGLGLMGMSGSAVAQNGSHQHLKALTVYFTRTGHTGTLAEMIHKQVGGDIFRVEAVEAYPEDYEATVQRARDERDSVRWPQVTPQVSVIRDYDIVFLGSPIWGDNLNPPMKRFIANHDLAGRRVAPFVSYKVSRMGQARRNIQQISPKARLLDGLAVLDTEVAKSEARVSAWVRRVQRA